MIIVMQSVHRHKMRVLASKFFGACVHHVRETFHTACNMFAQSIGNLICRSDKNCLQTLVYGQFLAFVDGNIRTVIRNTENRVMRKSYNLIQITIFRSDQSCKNFGDAGGIQLLMDIFGIQNRSAVRVHQNSSLCADRRPFRPAFRLITLNGKQLPVLRLRLIIDYLRFNLFHGKSKKTSRNYNRNCHKRQHGFI